MAVNVTLRGLPVEGKCSHPSQVQYCERDRDEVVKPWDQNFREENELREVSQKLSI